MTYQDQFLFFGGEFFNHSITDSNGIYISDPYLLKFDTNQAQEVNYLGTDLEALKTMEEYFSYQSYNSMIDTTLQEDVWEVFEVQGSTDPTVKNITESRCFGKKLCPV